MRCSFHLSDGEKSECLIAQDIGKGEMQEVLVYVVSGVDTAALQYMNLIWILLNPEHFSSKQTPCKE